ncbi:NAD-P-binding protein [Daedaleopsis nitida]|nr:NAD-P-binding protein [Daedaleopsis nitida]
MADVVLGSLTASNLFDMTGVIAVVTGGGTGIGLMISSTLLANGATVYIVGPKQDDLDRISKVYSDAAAAAGKPGRMYGIAGDVRLKSEALRLAGEVGKREKHITVLFNNAGVLSGSFQKPTVASASAFRKAYFDDVPEESFDHNIRTNAVGPYWLTFAFLPLLEAWKASAHGQRFAPQIVMTSSMNGWTKDLATAGFSFPYMYSKSAIGHATSSLAHELLPLGIRVNGIAPGFFVTEMTAQGTADAAGNSKLRENQTIAFDVPVSRPMAEGVQRAGTNKDMAALVLFLVANWFVDGETVLIDGGTLLKHPSSY